MPTLTVTGTNIDAPDANALAGHPFCLYTE